LRRSASSSCSVESFLVMDKSPYLQTSWLKFYRVFQKRIQFQGVTWKAEHHDCVDMRTEAQDSTLTATSLGPQAYSRVSPLPLTESPGR
jgi:hypothetical protein